MCRITGNDNLASMGPRQSGKASTPDVPSPGSAVGIMCPAAGTATQATASSDYPSTATAPLLQSKNVWDCRQWHSLVVEAPSKAAASDKVSYAPSDM